MKDNIEVMKGNAFMNWLDLIRVQHWVKNFFIFLPLFFAFKFFNAETLGLTVWAFFAFSFVASGVYIINDYFDRKKDALHPRKRNRPIASGKISPGPAFLLAAILFIMGFSILAILSKMALFWGIIYLVLNFLYSLGLKQISVLDVLLVSSGFVIRLFIGGAVSDIPLSGWIITVTFFLALLLALSKRKADFILYKKEGAVLNSLNGYSEDFINILLAIVSTATIISYALYIVETSVVQKLKSDIAYATIVFVVAGIFRYLKLLFVDKREDPPTTVFLNDRFIQVTIMFWILAFGAIFYF